MRYSPRDESAASAACAHVQVHAAQCRRRPAVPRSASPPAAQQSDRRADRADLAQQASEQPRNRMMHGRGPEQRRCHHRIRQSGSVGQPIKATQRMDTICCMCQRWPGDQPFPTSCGCAHPVGDLYSSSAEPTVACRRESWSAKHIPQPAMLRQPSDTDLTQECLPKECVARHHGVCSMSGKHEGAQHTQQLQGRPERQVTSLQQDVNASGPSLERMRDEAVTESSHARLLSQIDAFMQSLQGPQDVHETAQPRHHQSPQHGHHWALAASASSLGSEEAWHSQRGAPAAVLPGRPSGLSKQGGPHLERTAWLDEEAAPPSSTRQQAQHPLQDNRRAEAERTGPDRQHAECAAAEDEDPSSVEGTATASSAPRFREQQILPLHGVPSSPILNSPEAPAPNDLVDGAIPSTSAPQSGFERACACSKAPARRLSSLEHVSQASLDELEALLAEQQHKVWCQQGPCFAFAMGLCRAVFGCV